MINNRLNRILFSTLLYLSGIFFLSDYVLVAQRSQSSTRAGEQRKAEKGLHDNRYFIYFINSTITNNGTEIQKKQFREIIQRDIMSQFFYMKFLFFDSYSQVRTSQKKLIALYQEILVSEIKISKQQLDRFAPSVISSKDFLAKHYLYLGYRETKSTHVEMTMADSYKTTLYSMRLYRYVKAIKRVKEAKKYSLFAVIRLNQTPEEKLKQKPITYDEIEKKLSDIIPKEEYDSFKRQNADSYYKTIDISLYDSIWGKPELDSVEEFNKLLKRAE